MKRLWTPLAALAILALNLWLNGPLFMHGDLPFRGSIEAGYVPPSRFISAHPNPWAGTLSILRHPHALPVRSGAALFDGADGAVDAPRPLDYITA